MAKKLYREGNYIVFEDSERTDGVVELFRTCCWFFAEGNGRFVLYDVTLMEKSLTVEYGDAGDLFLEDGTTAYTENSLRDFLVNNSGESGDDTPRIWIKSINDGNPIIEGDDLNIKWEVLGYNGGGIIRFYINGAVGGDFTTPPPYQGEFNSPSSEFSLTEGNYPLKASLYDDNAVLIATKTQTFEVEAVTSLFLNDYPNLYGESWELHQLDTNFTGDVIEVRRDDNAVQRYGFVDGELPLGAIASFVSGGDGRISWYKGQANGLELIQPNAANQPWLFKNGVLQTEAGHPTLNFDGNQWLEGGDILNVEERPFMSIVVGNIMVDENSTFYSKNTNKSIVDDRYGLTNSGTYWDGSKGNRPVGGFKIYMGLKVINQTVVNDVQEVYINDSSVASRSEVGKVGNPTNPFYVGRIDANISLYFFKGNISAIHILFEDKLAELTAMNNKVNERYNIPF